MTDYDNQSFIFSKIQTINNKLMKNDMNQKIDRNTTPKDLLDVIDLTLDKLSKSESDKSEIESQSYIISKLDVKLDTILQNQNEEMKYRQNDNKKKEEVNLQRCKNCKFWEECQECKQKNIENKKQYDLQSKTWFKSIETKPIDIYFATKDNKIENQNDNEISFDPMNPFKHLINTNEQSNNQYVKFSDYVYGGSYKQKRDFIKSHAYHLNLNKPVVDDKSKNKPGERIYCQNMKQIVIPETMKLKDSDNNEVYLKVTGHEKYLVLAFYPVDHLKWEIDFVKTFNHEKAEFEKYGAKIMMICTDSVESHNKFKLKQGFSLTLLSDEEKKLMDVLGTKNDKGRYLRHIMVLDNKRKCIAHWKDLNVRDNNAKPVLEWIKKRSADQNINF